MGSLLVFLQVRKLISVRVAIGTIHAGGVQRIKLILDFPAIRQAIAICVRIVRISLVLVFFQVGQSIGISITSSIVNQGIEVMVHFPAVGHTITIGIGVVGVGTD